MMQFQKDKKLALENLSFPLKYDDAGQIVFDSQNNHVLDVRGWGRLQHLPNGEEIQDAIGRYVVLELNKLQAKSHCECGGCRCFD